MQDVEQLHPPVFYYLPECSNLDELKMILTICRNLSRLARWKSNNNNNNKNPNDANKNANKKNTTLEVVC